VLSFEYLTDNSIALFESVGNLKSSKIDVHKRLGLFSRFVVSHTQPQSTLAREPGSSLSLKDEGGLQITTNYSLLIGLMLAP
jgi:hypothetical protein